MKYLLLVHHDEEAFGKMSETIRKELVDRYGYTNPHQIPRVEKITLNMGVGSAIGDKKIVDLARNMIRLAGYEPETDIAIAISETAIGAA